MAPLVDNYLARHPSGVPAAVGQQLRALALRHAAWHRVRTVALSEMLDAFARQSIESLLLKGAALAWMIYPSPALRPMSDVDILVPRATARPAQETLRRLGYVTSAGRRRFGSNAHHLPAASRTRDGLNVSVEIHLDALSRDAPSSIAFGNLTESPRTFQLNGSAASTLGHIDTLRHLTHHLLEPSPDGYIRLIGAIDLLRYAATFFTTIDWTRLEARHPSVLNTLRCLHFVIPLPAVLSAFTPPSSAPSPGRAGEAIRPFRELLSHGRRGWTALNELFDPPEWWMHAYYNVPPDQPLTHVRLLRHPWQVARWLRLRLSGF
jgi:hypothetical protein